MNMDRDRGLWACMTASIPSLPSGEGSEGRGETWRVVCPRIGSADLNSLSYKALDESHRQSHRWREHVHRLRTATATLVRVCHVPGSAGCRLLPYFAPAPFSHTAMRLDFIEEYGLSARVVSGIEGLLHGVSRPLIIGRGQNCPKTPLLLPSQSKIASESMVSCQ